MSPTAGAGALVITLPRVWTAAQRLEFMADVARRALPCERWAHVGELMCTDSIDATATERRAVGLGALVVGVIAALWPERWTRRFWPGWLWVVPALAMIACVYLTMPWFRLYP